MRRQLLRSALFISLLVATASALATQPAWEYLVIFLPGTAAGATVEKHSSGGFRDATKTKILNNLARDGWEVVSVVGASGADHAVYLRRKK